MQYVKQEVFARLIIYNFCAAVVASLTPHNSKQAVSSENSAFASAGIEEEPSENVGIAFIQAVTVCRKLIVENDVDFIRNAINTIRAHTYESKAGRSYTRNVKPKSFKSFNHKPG